MHVEFEIYDMAVNSLQESLRKLRKFYPMQYDFEAYADSFDTKITQEIIDLSPCIENEEIHTITNVIYFSGLMSKLTKELYFIMHNDEMIQHDINSYKKDIIQYSLKDDIKRLKNIVRQDYFDLAEQHDNDIKLFYPDFRVKNGNKFLCLLIDVCEN